VKISADEVNADYMRNSRVLTKRTRLTRLMMLRLEGQSSSFRLCPAFDDAS